MSASKPPNEAAQGTSESLKRGRAIPSRYMNTTASSRAAATSKAASTRLKPSSATLGFAKGGPAVSTRSNQSASTSSATKPRTASSQSSQSSNVSTSHAQKQNARPHMDEPVGARSSSDDQLEVASQLYPWLFMRHTLSESSDVAATKAEAVFIAREKELDAEEEALADDGVRCQAEREIKFIDELSHERICRAAPPLIRKFVQSHKSCQDAISHAVRITSSRDKWDVKIARTRLRDLEQFAKDSTLLREAFAELAYDLPPDSLLAFTLGGLIRSLDARLKNLQVSRELLVKMRDNFMTACHLDSLGIPDL